MTTFKRKNLKPHLSQNILTKNRENKKQVKLCIRNRTKLLLMKL